MEGSNPSRHAKPHWRDCDEIIRIVEEAGARGLDITADQNPYTYTGTGLQAWIPKWAREGGNKALAERFKDSEQSRRIKEGLMDVMTLRSGPKAALITSYPLNDVDVGKTIAEVAEELGKDPCDTIFDFYKKHVVKVVQVS